MKYFNKVTKTVTETYVDATTTIEWNDPRVIAFFKPLPENHKLEFDTDGFPIISEIPSPTQAELDAIATNNNNSDILSQIEALERTLIRPLREYALDNTNTTALDKITNIEADIVILRGQLK